MLLTKYKVLHFVLRTAVETKIATPFLVVSGVIYWLQSQIIYWPHTFVNAPVPISPGVAAEEGQGVTYFGAILSKNQLVATSLPCCSPAQCSSLLKLLFSKVLKSAP